MGQDHLLDPACRVGRHSASVPVVRIPLDRVSRYAQKSGYSLPGPMSLVKPREEGPHLLHRYPVLGPVPTVLAREDAAVMTRAEDVRFALDPASPPVGLGRTARTFPASAVADPV